MRSPRGMSLRPPADASVATRPEASHHRPRADASFRNADGNASARPSIFPIDMNDQFVVTCPYCGEAIDIYIESDVRGTFVQECEVCCNPWRVRVHGTGDDRYVEVHRADGSE